jgi:hypothetical protein
MIFFGFLFLQTRVLSRASLSFSKSEDKIHMLPDLEKLFGVFVMISSKSLILLQYRYNVPHPNYVCMFTVLAKIIA